MGARATSSQLLCVAGPNHHHHRRATSCGQPSHLAVASQASGEEIEAFQAERERPAKAGNKEDEEVEGEDEEATTKRTTMTTTAPPPPHRNAAAATNTTNPPPPAESQSRGPTPAPPAPPAPGSREASPQNTPRAASPTPSFVTSPDGPRRPLDAASPSILRSLPRAASLLSGQRTPQHQSTDRCKWPRT
ncbi:hypothetical protein B0T26DRAFT_671992 [Lasiosphaeria miniovina]|uniref:Uncharacterized protein n=1 Tax=Lasiosphaeria miniovina TaxID=1954250 RepID=A0AA40E7Y3_9PEZI|nr:uncharacterized protein B0T26DRAFT_671992 [Lasiosphaeria miniovina]KAK0727311.1 hypothetical protein B0T26DRAFT_671992 [Lasiosphaeria miniovina]